MFSSRKQAGVAARLTKIATELQGLEKSGALLGGALLEDAVAAHGALQQATTSLQDALAAARAASRCSASVSSIRASNSPAPFSSCASRMATCSAGVSGPPLLPVGIPAGLP